MDAANATPDGTDTSGAQIVSAIADVFKTGINAYVDSQYAGQYQIQDPRYYNNGYPGGVASNTTTLRAIVNTPGAILFAIGLGVILILALRR